jgi:hypothetical protein
VFFGRVKNSHSLGPVCKILSSFSLLSTSIRRISVHPNKSIRLNHFNPRSG